MALFWGHGDLALRWTPESAAPLVHWRDPRTSELTDSIHAHKYPSQLAKLLGNAAVPKKPPQPHKMPNFFLLKSCRLHTQWPEDRATNHSNGHEGHRIAPGQDHLHSGSSSSASSPSTRSPAKSKPRMDPPVRPHDAQDMKVSGQQGNNTAQASHIPDPIADFPTADRLISDPLLKEMLISLRSAPRIDMVKGINQCNKEVQAIGVRVDQVEHQMEEYTSTYNIMVYAHAVQGEDIAWLKDKVADLEDKSRRNNIKLRGVPESVPATHLLQYAQALFSTLVPALTTQDLLMDKIHRIPKPSFLPEGTPKGILLMPCTHDWKCR